nr:hypothetical protein [Tanacetum cinerariifolium]
LLNLKNPSSANNEIASLMETSVPHTTAIPEFTSGFTTTTPQPPPFFNPLLQQQTPTFITTTSTNPTMTLPDIPNFAFVFKFDQRVSALESEMSELKQTNQLTEAVSSIMGIADKYLASKMKEAVVVAVQLQTNKLKEEAQAENQEFRKRSLQAPPKTLPNHNISLPARDNDEQPADKEVTKADWFKKPERPPTPDLDWSKRHQVDFQPTQTWISQAALAEEPPTSFDEFNDTSFDFSAFAATYELKWIEDLVHELWSPVVAKYDQHAYLGTSHWGPKRQRLYGYARNLTSSKDVYSRRRIIAVSRLRIMKRYRHAALSEEVDAESRDVRQWKDIRERSQASGKDNITLSYFVSTHFRGISTWGGRVKVYGTVPVSAGVQEVLWERWGNRGKMAGKVVRCTGELSGDERGIGQFWQEILLGVVRAGV